jgi:NTP pyrophosphatase (non-canonical NTP hydrolase)
VNEKLKKIINTYGVAHQLKYFQSEVYELTEAILWNELTPYSHEDTEHIAEEIADCLIFLKQFQIYYNIKQNQIDEIMEFKIDRTLKRTEDGYYD